MAFRIRVTSAMPKSIPRAGQSSDRKRALGGLVAGRRVRADPVPSRGPPVREELVQQPRQETRDLAEGVPEVGERVNPELPAGPTMEYRTAADSPPASLS